MMEVRSSVLPEHPQFDRSLLHAPAVSCCSRAGVSIAGLCWTSAAGQLSPAFFMHHQAARESQKNTVQARSLINLAHMRGREPVGFALLQRCDLPRCLAQHVADFTQLHFCHIVTT